MSEASRPKRHRRFRRWLVWMVILPLIGLALGNFILATPLGTGFFEKQLEKRLSVPSEIGRISWTPWSGGRVHDLKINAPTEDGEEISLALVDQVIIDPSWLSMLKGKKRFDRVEVRGVTIDLELESLKPLLKSHTSEVKDAPEVVDVKRPEKTASKKEETQAKEKPKREIVIVKPQGEQGEQGEKSVVVPVENFQGILVMSSVNCRIHSKLAPQLEFSFSDLSGDIPLWGEARSGELDFQGLRVGADGSMESLTLPVKWSNGYLQISEPELHLLGLHLSLDAAMSFASGLPFGVKMDVPAQRINFTSLRKDAPPVDIASFSSQNVLQGYFLHPSLSRGSSKTQIKKCVVKDPSDGSRLVFERGGSSLTFSSAGVFANDFRLIGEEEAFLGNGFLRASGVGAATLRVIANPQRAETFKKRITQANPAWSLGLSPLVTVDRWHRDLRFDLSSQGFTVDLGKGKSDVPLREVVSRVRQGYGSNRVNPVP